MLSCKKAAQLIDRKSVTRLSRVEHWQLTFHLRMCNVCSAYEKQSSVIDQTTQKFYRVKPTEKHLPESAKSKIIKALKEK
jgi:hypothetical protein